MLHFVPNQVRCSSYCSIDLACCRGSVPWDFLPTSQWSNWLVVCSSWCLLERPYHRCFRFCDHFLQQGLAKLQNSTFGCCYAYHHFFDSKRYLERSIFLVLLQAPRGRHWKWWSWIHPCHQKARNCFLFLHCPCCWLLLCILHLRYHQLHRSLRWKRYLKNPRWKEGSECSQRWGSRNSLTKRSQRKGRPRRKWRLDGE